MVSTRLGADYVAPSKNTRLNYELTIGPKKHVFTKRGRPETISQACQSAQLMTSYIDFRQTICFGNVVIYVR
jgi:hypothetical protein